MTPDEFKKILLLQIQSWESGKALSVESLLGGFLPWPTTRFICSRHLSERQLSSSAANRSKGNFWVSLPRSVQTSSRTSSARKSLYRGALISWGASLPVVEARLLSGRPATGSVRTSQSRPFTDGLVEMTSISIASLERGTSLQVSSTDTSQKVRRSTSP